MIKVSVRRTVVSALLATMVLFSCEKPIPPERDHSMDPSHVPGGPSAGQDVPSGPLQYDHELFSPGEYAVPWSVGLRLRRDASASADIRGTLNLWEPVKVLEQDRELVHIGGNAGFWVLVERADGSTGWCFSYYLTTYQREDFFPVLCSNTRTGELCTFLGSRRRQDKLSLNWQGRTISRFPGLRVSGDGTVILFNWADPESLAPSGIREFTGKEYLFMYDFKSHQVMEIDSENFTITNARNIDYWKWEINRGFREPAFRFALNYDGTRVFYVTTDEAGKQGRSAGIEYLAKSGSKKTGDLGGRIPDEMAYKGKFILLTFEEEFLLYDPGETRLYREEELYPGWLIEEGLEYTDVLGVQDNRYLVIRYNNIVYERGYEGVNGYLISDLKTGEDVLFTDDWLGPRKETETDWAYQCGNSVIRIHQDLRNVPHKYSVYTAAGDGFVWNRNFTFRGGSYSYWDIFHPLENGILVVHSGEARDRRGKEVHINYFSYAGDSRGIILTEETGPLDGLEFHYMEMGF